MQTSEGIKEIKYTFKKAMEIEYLKQQGDFVGIQEKLGLSYDDTLAFLSVMQTARWVRSSSKEKMYEKLTVEQRIKIAEAEKVFDYLMDFDAYYTDFIEYYGIDLLEQDIDFVKFGWLLDGILNKEDSHISKRIGFRVFKPSKDMSPQYKTAMAERQDLYAFSTTEKNTATYKKLRGE